jgi:hypothetical protein
MPNEHQDFQNQSRKPDRQLDRPHHQRHPTVANFRGPTFQRDVPRIALIRHAREPDIHARDDIIEAHARALREMPELVRNNSRQFARREIRYQRQAQYQHEVVAKQAEKSPAKTRSGVELAIEINAFRRRRADNIANLFDERV